MSQCLVALGGNLGPVEQTFARAVDALQSTPTVDVIAVSSTHRTTPVGTDSGDAYRNAAILLDTRLAPLELLDRLQQIENVCGRVRERHWGPRTLDLDLITFGDEMIDEPRLSVPHPACWYRRFVLDPIVEIAADAVHPVKRMTFRELRDRLMRRPLTFRVVGGDRAQRETLVQGLLAAFSSESVASVDSSEDAVLVFDLDPSPANTANGSANEVSRVSVPGNDDNKQFQFARDVLTAALG